MTDGFIPIKLWGFELDGEENIPLALIYKDGKLSFHLGRHDQSLFIPPESKLCIEFNEEEAREESGGREP